MKTIKQSKTRLLPLVVIGFSVLTTFLTTGLKTFAQNAEPKSVGIYYTPLDKEPSLTQKCLSCDYLSSDLTKIPGVRVLERSAFDKIQNEQDLSSSGLVNDETKVKPGNILSAERGLTVTGIDYLSGSGMTLDDVVNFTCTDFKTGRIAYSRNNQDSYSAVLGDLNKVFSGTYKPTVTGPANQGRTLRSIYVSIPVNYNFQFKGVFPPMEEGEETVVRESTEGILLKDGEMKDEKRKELSFSNLTPESGEYRPGGFTVYFQTSTLDNNVIWMNGKYNADKSKIESLEIHRTSLTSTSYNDSYSSTETLQDVVKVSNLTYRKTSMGGQYEFVPGVSKIDGIVSTRKYYEQSDMPKKILTATHDFGSIDENRPDPIKGKAVPSIYMMSADNAGAVLKPIRKIILRGNWPGYAFIVPKLFETYANVEVCDQTDLFRAKAAFEKSLNASGKGVAEVPGAQVSQPAAGEAILTFSRQSDSDGTSRITTEIRTAGKSNKITFSLPVLFKGASNADVKEGDSQGKTSHVGKMQADYTYNRLLLLGIEVVDALNK
jgi:hypothetical protein